MDYEKKYKEALEKLRSLHDNYDTVSTLIDIKEELEYIFPELRESEDEKVRKTLIRVLNENIGNGIEKYGAKLEEALAWLEKQDKPSDEDMKEALRTEYEKGRADAIAEIRKKWDDSKKKRQEVISFLESLRLKED